MANICACDLFLSCSGSDSHLSISDLSSLSTASRDPPVDSALTGDQHSQLTGVPCPLLPPERLRPSFLLSGSQTSLSSSWDAHTAPSSPSLQHTERPALLTSSSLNGGDATGVVLGAAEPGPHTPA